MILNRLITVEGNQLNFTVNHTQNGEKYVLAPGEYYRMIIKDENNSGVPEHSITSSGDYFSFFPGYSAGTFAFEIGLCRANGTVQVILPAFDERHKRLNELIILEKM